MWDYRWIYLMLLPCMAFFIIFKYVPLYGIQLAFKDYMIAGIAESPWNNFEHFKYMMTEPEFIPALRNTLVMHEHVDARIKNDTLYINGRPTRHCRFSKDYYWVVANNSINLSDSRLFGFVPKDHIIGRASRIWFSKEEGSSLFSAYRWDRIWTKVR